MNSDKKLRKEGYKQYADFFDKSNALFEKKTHKLTELEENNFYTITSMDNRIEERITVIINGLEYYAPSRLVREIDNFNNDFPYILKTNLVTHTKINGKNITYMDYLLLPKNLLDNELKKK